MVKWKTLLHHKTQKSALTIIARADPKSYFNKLSLYRYAILL